MSSSLYDLLIKADTKELKEASSNLKDVASEATNAHGAIDKVAEVFEKLATPVGAATTALTACLVGMAKLGNEAIEAADNMNDIVTATGHAAIELQSWQAIAEKSGGTLEGLRNILEKVSRGMSKGDDDTVKFNKALDYFGVSAKKASGELKSSSELAQEVAQKYNEMADTTSRSAAASEVLGKGYQNMIPTLLELNKAEEEKNRIRESGAELDGNLRKAADEYNDSLHDLGDIFKGLGNDIARIMLPMMQGLVNALKSSATEGGILQGAMTGLKYVFEGVLIPVKAFASGLMALDLSVKVVGKGIGALIAMIQELGSMKIEFNWDALKAGRFSEVINVKGLEGAKRVYNEFLGDVEKDVMRTAENIDKLWTRKIERGGDEPSQDKPKDPNGKFVSTNEKVKQPKEKQELTAEQKANEALGKLIEKQIASLKLDEKQTEVSKVKAELETSQYKAGSEFYKKMAQDQAALIDKKKADLEITKEIKNINSGVDEQVKNMERQLRQRSMSAEAIRRENEALKVNYEIEKAKAELDPSVIGYKERLAELDKTRAEALAKINKQLDKEKAANQDALQGMKDGFKDYAESVKSNYDLMKDSSKTALTTMTDGLAEMVVTGKANFKSLVASVLEGFAKMMAQQAMMQAAMAAMSAFGFANGGAFEGGVQMFADGGVVSSPTAFPMAGNKVGVMGEAGPEAIMPLSRDANGRLGVKAASSSGGNVINVAPQVTLNIGSVDSKERAQELAMTMKQVSEQTTYRVIQDLMRPGNVLASVKR